MQRHQLKILLCALIALFLPTLIGLAAIDGELKVPASPWGIVSFEFCGFMSSCDETLSQWGVKGQQLALLSLGIDYLFMVIYPLMVCTGLLLVVSVVPKQLKRVTVFLAWIALSAGLADAAENFFLIRIILSGSGHSYGAIAGTCAAVKFAVFGATLGWLILISLMCARRGS